MDSAEELRIFAAKRQRTIFPARLNSPSQRAQRIAGDIQSLEAVHVGCCRCILDASRAGAAEQAAQRQAQELRKCGRDTYQQLLQADHRRAAAEGRAAGLQHAAGQQACREIRCPALQHGRC